MSKHIGIVACSAPGAALCYTTICAEAPEIMGANHNPEISLHMMDFCESPVYPERLASRGIEWCLPAAGDRDVVNRIIFDELVFSRITREAQAHFVRIIETFKSAHQCDAVVLGCTEIPLVVTPEASPLPTLDSTRLLARAALKMGCQ